MLSKASFPYTKTLISLSWLSDERYLSMFIKQFFRISLISLKNWHCRKKWNVVSASMLQEHSGFKVSSKLSRNLCSNPNLNLIGNLPTWSWMLKIFVYRDQVCFIPLWQTVKKSFGYILDPTIKRTTCIWMSCGSSNGWKKAIDIFRDFLWKTL